MGYLNTSFLHSIINTPDEIWLPRADDWFDEFLGYGLPAGFHIVIICVHSDSATM